MQPLPIYKDIANISSLHYYSSTLCSAWYWKDGFWKNELFRGVWGKIRDPKVWLYMSLYSHLAKGTGFLSLHNDSARSLGNGWKDSICSAWHAFLQGRQSQTRSTGHHQPAPVCQVTEKNWGQAQAWAKRCVKLIFVVPKMETKHG